MLAAHDLFRSAGYSATSVDRIAERAGFSKGAFYSNFDSKEAILLAVLDMARSVFDDLLLAISNADDRAHVVRLLVAWADDRSRNGNGILAILEHAKSAQPGAQSVVDLNRMLQNNWRRLGNALLVRFPGMSPDAEALGALLHQIAYAPAITIVSQPTAGQLMQLAASALLAGEAVTSSPAPEGHCIDIVARRRRSQSEG